MSRIVLYRLPIIDELQRVAELRALSLRGVAAELQVAPTTVSNWYRGVTTPSVDAALQSRLVAFLDVAPAQVLRLFGLDLTDA